MIDLDAIRKRHQQRQQSLVHGSAHFEERAYASRFEANLDIDALLAEVERLRFIEEQEDVRQLLLMKRGVIIP